ncbi:MAG: hypothetical protein MJE63_20145 [Proteobacteria bacterium]|nr:hypothetical protein [Pseudomonadota bacterium]
MSKNQEMEVKFLQLITPSKSNWKGLGVWPAQLFKLAIQRPAMIHEKLPEQSKAGILIGKTGFCALS